MSKTRKAGRIEAVLLLFLISGLCLHAGSIEGTVRDATGIPLQGILITLSSTSAPVSEQVISGADGIFRSSNIPAGKYEAEAKISGYIPLLQPEITVPDKGSVVIDFSMEKSGLVEGVRLAFSLPQFDLNRETAPKIPPGEDGNPSFSFQNARQDIKFGFPSSDSLRATDPGRDPFFMGLKLQGMVMAWADLTLSYMAVGQGIADEGNPLARFYFKYPAVTVAAQVLQDILFNFVSNELYKRSKLLGYVSAILYTGYRAYILYGNFKLMNDR